MINEFSQNKFSTKDYRVASFFDLRVYRSSCELDQKIFELSKTFPREEMYSITDQFRRASRSVGANIAEAWAKRSYPAHFRSKLTDADSELNETRHWIFRAQSYAYLKTADAEDLTLKCNAIGAMLGRILADAESFCKPAGTNRPNH
jgi:four helix bundle protein